MYSLNVEEALAKVVASPEDDASRMAFAALIAGQEPSHSRFIELQLQRVSRKRRDIRSPGATDEEEALLESHRVRWMQAVTVPVKQVEFHRGFISRAVVDPYVFIEQGEKLLLQAPIRHVAFTAVPNRKFPLDEILRCASLREMDSVGLAGLSIDDSDAALIAQCENMSRCLWLGLAGNPLGLPGFRALAASQKDILYIDRENGRVPEYHPGQRLGPPEHEHPWNAPIPEWQPLGEDGQALEREFGYIPWLHPQENACDKFDARYFVERGMLPKKPPGSPVEQ